MQGTASIEIAHGSMPAAFDRMARSYDEFFTHTAVGQVLRAMVWNRAAQLFQAPMEGAGQLLELGCGTGEDAVRFARAGWKVTATDASSEMIEVARDKARQSAGPLRAIDFTCLPMEQVAANFPGRRFDGIFSNFGAVNCVADLRSLSASLATILAPGAPLLWVVMGRHVPWEWAWYLARGNPAKAFRRLRSTGTTWRGMTISYPTPWQLSTMLGPDFTVTRVAPLGWVLPPSYAAHWLERSPRMLTMLRRLEHTARNVRPLANWSDHYIVEARRAV